MPEIEFFAIEEEIIELVGWLLDRDCEFIPDLHYATASFDQIADLRTIQSLAKSVAQFHIVQPDFIESPIGIREVNTANKHFFYVSPRVGGPMLQLYWGRQFQRGARMHLSATELGFYPWYENSISGAREKPPKALRDLYKEFAKTVRQSRRKIKPGQREFWISQKVERLIRAGWVLVGLEGMPTEQILTVPSVEKRMSS